MLKKVKATYSNGAFIPNSPCDLPENTEVELMVNLPFEYNQDVLDPETRKAIVHELLTRMRQTSLMTHIHHATVSE
ncbi:antitoxin family protein [Crocosphaera sp.]|uniref:antitoxin family protein n=1 Tax=Crocosphaera sp. TaxID=2729996 RepID=UPI0026223940|nr:antitoxin family protein [Crocosphaera sp.]MDJ0580298.1 antitoxin family protein [Crocosphaera sp.]